MLGCKSYLRFTRIRSHTHYDGSRATPTDMDIVNCQDDTNCKHCKGKYLFKPNPDHVTDLQVLDQVADS